MSGEGSPQLVAIRVAHRIERHDLCTRTVRDRRRGDTRRDPVGRPRLQDANAAVRADEIGEAPPAEEMPTRRPHARSPRQPSRRGTRPGSTVLGGRPRREARSEIAAVAVTGAVSEKRLLHVREQAAVTRVLFAPGGPLKCSTRAGRPCQTACSRPSRSRDRRHCRTAERCKSHRARPRSAGAPSPG